jgi:hypothetical protein
MVSARRKGASTLLVIFIVMVVALIGVTWFRVTGSTGTGLQQDLVRQSQIYSFNHRFQNTKLYLENSLYYAGQRGSNNATNMSGRISENQEARYWYCGGSQQIPDEDTVREATSNFTLRYMQNRTEEVHGIRRNTIYDIGRASCVDTGYETLPAGKDSDQFRQAVEIDSIELTRQGGELQKSDKNVKVSQEIKHNRKWYMYSVLKEWINNENLKDQVGNKLSGVEDQTSPDKTACIREESECDPKYPDPTMCADHDQLMDSAVVSGLQNEAEKLESNPQYFNDTEVKCSFSFNEKSGADYPGHQVGVGTNEVAVNQSTECGCAQQNATGHCIVHKYRHRCVTNVDLTITSKVDTTLTCRDTFFNNIPQNDSTGHMAWKIDISFDVSDGPSGPTYSCTQAPYSVPPTTLRTCSYTSTQTNTCSTGVDVIG